MAGLPEMQEQFPAAGFQIADERRARREVKFITAMMKIRRERYFFAASSAALTDAARQVRRDDHARNFAQFCANDGFSELFLRRAKKKFSS